MFVRNFELDNLTWSIMPAQACMHMPVLIISYQNITIKPYGAQKRKIYSEVLKSNLFQIFWYHLRHCLWNISSLESYCLTFGVFQYWKTIWMKDSLTLVLSGGKLQVPLVICSKSQSDFAKKEYQDMTSFNIKSWDRYKDMIKTISLQICLNIFISIVVTAVSFAPFQMHLK